MELKPEQLAARGTTEPLHPVYLIAGPETLRVLVTLVSWHSPVPVQSPDQPVKW